MIEQAPRKSDKLIRIGVILWLLCLLFIVAEQIAAYAYFPHYSFNYQRVAELGVTRCDLETVPATCSPHALLMNLSQVLEGLFIAGGALLARRAFHARFGFTVATTVLIIAGICVFWMGAAPFNFSEIINTDAVKLFLLVGGLAMLLYGGMFFTTPARSSLLGIVSLLAGLAVFIVGVLFATLGEDQWEELPFGMGVGQRIGTYGIPAWLAFVAIVILVRGSRPAPPLPGIYLPPPPPPRLKDAS